MSNPTLVLNKVDDISFHNNPVPAIEAPTDVIVQVLKTGICGSDIAYYKYGAIGPFVLKDGDLLVLGHESSGVVSKVGDGVKTLKVGDRVAIEPGVPSRYSDEYKSGHYNLCREMVFAATPSIDAKVENPPGTLTKYYKSPEDFLVKLPDHVSLELGALVEPLSVGVHANKQASTRFGDFVVVYGAGPVGLLAAATARKFGAAGVLVVDVFDSKLLLAAKLGVATHTFNSKKGGAKDLLEAFGGHLPTVALECTGAEPCIQLAVAVLAPGGRFVQVGNAHGNVAFPITEFATKELNMFGSFRYGYNDYRTAVGILDENYKSGREKAVIDFEGLITHRFAFKDAIKAYDLVRAGGDVVKAIIDGPE